MADKRVLVTGASGFIGRALVPELAAHGYDVVALTRNASAHQGLFPHGAVIAQWDGRTASGWGHLADGALAVVNLAGDNLAQGRWTRAKKDRILRSRTDAGAAVVAAVRAARIRPRVLIQASAIGFYGHGGEDEVDEDAPAGTDFIADLVRQWEEATREVESFGVRRAVVRSGLVLGRNEGVWPRLLRPFRFFAGGPLGNGRQWFSWITLEDEARALRYLIESDGLSGIFNLTSPGPVRQREFCRIVGRAVGRPCWLPVPAVLLTLLFGEKARETILAGPRVVPRRLAAAGFEFGQPDAAAAVEVLLR